jgi:hypothetical protein
VAHDVTFAVVRPREDRPRDEELPDALGEGMVPDVHP